jgi:hypothetical protein
MIYQMMVIISFGVLCFGVSRFQWPRNQTAHARSCLNLWSHVCDEGRTTGDCARGKMHVNAFTHDALESPVLLLETTQSSRESKSLGLVDGSTCIVNVARGREARTLVIAKWYHPCRNKKNE